MALKLTTFRAGSPRRKAEGLRLGTVRFLPRGVRREDYARLDYFDVWLPALAPSRELVKWAHAHHIDQDARAWKTYAARYRREMLGRTDSRQALQLIAALAARTPIAIGCYCADEGRCHRSLLRELIEAAAAT